MERAAQVHAAREGDRVVAQDGALGRVDRIVRSEADGPVYLVVSVGRVVRRYPILHSALVRNVDASSRTVHVRGRRRSLERLSESLPLVG
jgi:hypothetical protein